MLLRDIRDEVDGEISTDPQGNVPPGELHLTAAGFCC
jgi:hypothetical protein